MSVSHFLVLAVLIAVVAGLPTVCRLRASAMAERTRLETERVRKDTDGAIWFNRTIAEGGIASLAYIMLERMLTGADERARMGECTTVHYDIPDNWAPYMNKEMDTQFRDALESIVKTLGFSLHVDYTAILTTTAHGPDHSTITTNNIARYRVGWCK